MNSAVSLYYYIRIVVFIYLKKETTDLTMTVGTGQQTVPLVLND